MCNRSCSNRSVTANGLGAALLTGSGNFLTGTGCGWSVGTIAVLIGITVHGDISDRWDIRYITLQSFATLVLSWESMYRS